MFVREIVAYFLLTPVVSCSIPGERKDYECAFSKPANIRMQRQTFFFKKAVLNLINISLLALVFLKSCDLPVNNKVIFEFK